MIQNNKAKPMLTMTIFSLSFILTISMVINVASSEIMNAFVGVDANLISMIFTLPSLTAIVTTLLCGYVADFSGKKALAIIGLSLWTIGGLIGVFTDNIYILLGSRALLGLGQGFIQPLASSMLADFFGTRSEFGKYMGFMSVVMYAGGALFNYIAGLLVLINWRYAMVLHALGIVVILLIIIFVPGKSEYPKYEVPTVEKTGKPKGRLPLKLIPTYVLLAIAGMCAYALSTNIAVVLSERSLGNAATAGTLIVVQTVVATVFSLMFGKIYRLFKHYTIGMSALFSMISLAIASKAATLPLMFVAVVFAGLSQALFTPAILTELTVAAGPLVTKAHAFAWVATGVGSFMLSIILVPLSVSLLGSGMGTAPIRLAAYTMISVVICYFLLAFVNRPQKAKTKQN